MSVASLPLTQTTQCDSSAPSQKCHLCTERVHSLALSLPKEYGRGSCQPLLMAAAVALLPVNPATRFPLSSGVTITDPSMTVISTMVQRDDLWGATARV